MVVLLSVVMLVSHQLTPVILLGAVAVLTVTGRCWTPRLLPVLGALVVIWLTTGASAYLGGHPVLFVESAHEATSAAVQDRLRGTSGHLHVIDVRFAMTLGVLALAGIGMLRLWRVGHRDFRPALLMIFPFLLVPFQSYGGEMLMRATLFALPFAVYYGAVPFLRAGDRTGRVTGQRVSATVLLVAAFAGVGVVAARYGNADFDTFTHDEIAGAQALYRLAPPGAALVTPAHPTPWKYREYLSHHYLVLTEQCGPSTNSDECYQMVLDQANQNPGGAMLMFTRASNEAMRIQGLHPGLVVRRRAACGRARPAGAPGLREPRRADLPRALDRRDGEMMTTSTTPPPGSGLREDPSAHVGRPDPSPDRGVLVVAALALAVPVLSTIDVLRPVSALLGVLLLVAGPGYCVVVAAGFRQA